MGKRTLKPAAPGADVDDDVELEDHTVGDDGFYDSEAYDDADNESEEDEGEGEASTPEVAGSSPAVAGNGDVAQLDRAPGPQSEERASDGDAPAGRSPAASPNVGELRTLLLATIAPDPAQARDEGADEDLAPSIAAQGVLQPIRVYAHQEAPIAKGGKLWMIDDGERRYRGALKAGLTEIPARIIDPPTDEGDKLLRQNLLNDGKRLKPMEEARSWKRIMTAKGWTINQLAAALGRAKSTVSDRVALLEAPKEFLSLIERGALSAAAAPILRTLAPLTGRAKENVVNGILEDWQFEDALRDSATTGKPVPLKDLEEAVDDALKSQLALIDATLDTGYKGKTVQIGERLFAIDVDAYRAAEAKAKAAAPKPKPVVSPAEAKAREQEKALKKKQAAQNAKFKEEQDRALALHRARYEAVSAKLPPIVDGAFALILLRKFVPSWIGPDMITAIGRA